jgi:hypothetical protein
MAVWQMMKAGKPTGDMFDDGAAQAPGDDGFSTSAVQTHLASLGASADSFNYVGVTNPVEQ